MESSTLRTTIRNGEKVIQQAIWVYDLEGNKTNDMIWVDVPHIEVGDE